MPSRKNKIPVPAIIVSAIAVLSLSLFLTNESRSPAGPEAEISCLEYVFAATDTASKIDIHSSNVNEPALFSREYHYRRFLEGISFPPARDAEEMNDRGYEAAFGRGLAKAFVQVAIIDDAQMTATTDPEGSRGTSMSSRSGHGASVAAIASKIACVGEENFEKCNVAFDLHDIMTKGTRDTNALARAVCSAAENRLDESTPLVISLSVGFPKDAQGGDLVRRALEYSVCGSENVIVFAAAGNKKMVAWKVLDENGVLAPAAWEDVLLEDIEEKCRATNRPFFKRKRSDLPRRLVYAVGAVDGNDRPLNVSRIGGSPVLNVMSDHALAFDPKSGSLTTPITGTSAGPAVASGLAAAIWRRHPWMTASQVLEHIYQNSVLLEKRASFCPRDDSADPHACNMRRLVVEPAITKAPRQPGN